MVGGCVCVFVFGGCAVGVDGFGGVGIIVVAIGGLGGAGEGVYETEHGVGAVMCALVAGDAFFGFGWGVSEEGV